VTPDLERSAFADDRARTLLLRARAARLEQDSALQRYDANTYQRISAGLGVRRFGPEKLLMRIENAARVRWDRQRGVTVQPTGRRSVFPAIKDAESELDISDGEGITTVPYFPGRETLWFPSSDMGVARAEVDENELLHPLATGAEAYYRYATGDSVGIRLPDGRRIALRELRITARKANWRAFVGSFWFDVERGSLVRAAYRMSQDLDIWEIANEDERRELDSLRTALRGDASPAARERLREAERKYEEDKVPGWVSGAFRPAKARISAITVEYGLHEGRFWLPRRNVAEGLGEFAFVRVPVKFEESFRYEGVNATPPRGAAAVAELPPVPTPPADPAQLRTA
jgi:hypothetical protein